MPAFAWQGAVDFNHVQNITGPQCAWKKSEQQEMAKLYLCMVLPGHRRYQAQLTGPVFEHFCCIVQKLYLEHLMTVLRPLLSVKSTSMCVHAVGLLTKYNKHVHDAGRWVEGRALESKAA